jgi:hypothetical protein
MTTIASDLAACIKSRQCVLWTVSGEELRVERALAEAGAKLGFQVRTWDCERALLDLQGQSFQIGGRQSDDLTDPEQALRAVRQETAARHLWIFRDLDAWLSAPTTRRIVKNLARDLQGLPVQQVVVILSQGSELPADLRASVAVIDWPLPTREEIASVLEVTVSNAIKSLNARIDGDLAQGVAPAGPQEAVAIRAKIATILASVANGRREAAIEAAVGLPAEEAATCYAKSMVTTGLIDPALVQQAKKQAISRERVLQWYDPDPRGLDAVGGLDALKRWLVQRRLAFSAKAREFGLPAPKGLFLVGVPGSGKSLTAKAVATAWGMPLLRLDLGALRSKWIGESEANIRRALQVAERVAPAILWLDEVEKALGGSTGPQGDGGVASDALGTILTWLQEKAGAVFVVATANDVTALPPELLRKGRFDEVFFADLPNVQERAAIAAVAIRQAKRDPSAFDLDAIAAATQDFTGAELSALVPDALFAAFSDGREVTTADMLAAARGTVPLARTASEKIDALRAWSKGRARSASHTATVAPKNAGPRYDL